MRVGHTVAIQPRHPSSAMTNIEPSSKSLSNRQLALEVLLYAGIVALALALIPN